MASLGAADALCFKKPINSTNTSLKFGFQCDSHYTIQEVLSSGIIGGSLTGDSSPSQIALLTSINNNCTSDETNPFHIDINKANV